MTDLVLSFYKDKSDQLGPGINTTRTAGSTYTDCKLKNLYPVCTNPDNTPSSITVSNNLTLEYITDPSNVLNTTTKKFLETNFPSCSKKNYINCPCKTMCLALDLLAQTSRGFNNSYTNHLHNSTCNLSPPGKHTNPCPTPAPPTPAPPTPTPPTPAPLPTNYSSTYCNRNGDSEGKQCVGSNYWDASKKFGNETQCFVGLPCTVSDREGICNISGGDGNIYCNTSDKTDSQSSGFWCESNEIKDFSNSCASTLTCRRNGENISTGGFKDYKYCSPPIPVSSTYCQGPRDPAGLTKFNCYAGKSKCWIGLPCTDTNGNNGTCNISGDDGKVWCNSTDHSDSQSIGSWCGSKDNNNHTSICKPDLTCRENWKYNPKGCLEGYKYCSDGPPTPPPTYRCKPKWGDTCCNDCERNRCLNYPNDEEQACLESGCCLEGRTCHGCPCKHTLNSKIGGDHTPEICGNYNVSINPDGSQILDCKSYNSSYPARV